MRVLMVTVAALLLAAANTGVAAAGDCDGQKCCAQAACCKHGGHDAAALGSDLAQITPGLEWPDDGAARPTREYAKVFFRDPVRVGGHFLMGLYIIEHDLDRMARGLPCTYIYAANDRRLPVIAFHCRHLDRKATEKATVTLRRVSDPTARIFSLVEYQFEGSTDGHGVPDVR